MFALVFGMLLCVSLGVAIMWFVAVPARREGREVLTPRGDEMVSLVRERAGSAVGTARVKTSGAMDVARDKVADVARLNEH
jgi:hypothetical protein